MNFLIILILALLILMFHPLVETAPGNPATLIQLATSSTNPLSAPYGHSPWLAGRLGMAGRAPWVGTNTRPVMQRGKYFNNPRWHR